MGDTDKLRPEDRACVAAPHAQLITEIMDSTIPKNEHGWAARREIETLRAELVRLADENAQLRDVLADRDMDREMAAHANRELAAIKARILPGAAKVEIADTDDRDGNPYGWVGGTLLWSWRMTMADIDTLRPEVREAMSRIEAGFQCDDDHRTIRAELLRLAMIEADALIALDCEHDWQVEHERAEKAEAENARLNKVESRETERRLEMEDVELYLMDVSQPEDEGAGWCDRMKSAIEGLVQDCNEAVGQKNQAIQRAETVEAELAALKARINK